MRLSRRSAGAWAVTLAWSIHFAVLALSASTAQAQADPSATSADGRWRIAAQAGEPGLVLFDADGRRQRSWSVATLDGRQTSKVAAIWASAARSSFIVALRDVAELWEILLDPQSAPIHEGLVHDYRMGEALATQGYLGVRRTPLDLPLADFQLDPSGRLVLGVVQPAAGGADALEVIHLDVRRRIARLPLDGPADMDRLEFVDHCGRRWLGVSGRQAGPVRWFDTSVWALHPVGPAPGEPCRAPGQPPG